jgi:uncharacterized protein YjbI with pentapeptide repeats
MPNNEHLALLGQGIVLWNQWRNENPHIIPELSEANLSKVNLYGYALFQANLSEADLSGSDLRKANLSRASLFRANLKQADLSEADLFGADLFEADLSTANLKKTQVFVTNFKKAQLTGACIEDWEFNHKTNFDDLICEYIYFKEDRQVRLPASRSFKVGEFVELFQKNLERFDRSEPRKFNSSSQLANKLVQPRDRKLAKTAAEIQQLLQNLSQTYPSLTYIEKVKIAVRALDYIDSNPILKNMIINTLKLKGARALIKAVKSPLADILLPVFSVWEKEE